MNKNAKWITSEEFSTLLPDEKIFHKEMNPYKPAYNEKLWNSHVLFRNKFNLTTTKNCKISISADDYYFLYINGQFVCSGPAPGYPWHYYYNEIDISEYAVIGENTIAVRTYYQGLVNRVWVSADNRHGMICQITSEGNVILSSDRSFKCCRDTAFNVYDIAVKHDTIFNELYDSNSKTIGFEAVDYDDSNWPCCKEKDNADYTLFKQDMPLLTYYDIDPETVRYNNNEVFVDIGKEIVGYLNITAKGKKGSEAIIRYAEELCDDGTPRYDLRCKCIYQDKWILSGKKDKFTHFDYKGFRYAQIILPDECEIDKISVTVRHLPFEYKTQFNSQDNELQKIWDLCKNTVKYGAQETFIDCPTREKGQYLGDVCISALSYTILTQNCDPLKKSIIDFGESSKICKGLMAVAPSSFMQEIADYSLLYPFIFAWYYHLTDDKAFVENNIHYVEGLLEYFKNYEREDGLIASVTEKWNIVDWPENMRDGYDMVIERPIGNICHNVINAFYIGAIKCYNLLCKEIGKKEIDVQKQQNSFVKAFYNSSTKLFNDTECSSHSAIHSNTLPLLFNIGISGENKAEIISFIKSKSITTCGTYFSYFTLQALKNNNEFEAVKNMIKDKNAWLNMLEEGATTTYEAWGKEQKKNTSLFHPWSTCPIIILYDMK